MKEKSEKQKKDEKLHNRVKELINLKDLRDLSDVSIKELIHELAIHQAQLEMQNEELRKSQADLEESRSKYSDLYDFAPVGYFTFDKNGLIPEVNLTGAELLGVERSSLINQYFSHYVNRDDQDILYAHIKQVFQTRARLTCQIELMGKNTTKFYAQLDSIAVKDSKGNFSHCRTAVSDFTDRKQAEEKIIRDYHIQSTTNSILQISLEPVSLKLQLERILDLIISLPWLAVKSKGCIYFVEDDPNVLVMKAQRGFSEIHQTTCAKIPFEAYTAGDFIAAITQHIPEKSFQMVRYYWGY